MIDFASAADKRRAKVLEWEERVARLLGERGVWPEEACELAEGTGRLMKSKTAQEVATDILQRMGWPVDE